MSEKIVTSCPACDKKHRVLAEEVGVTITCSGCGQSFEITSPDAHPVQPVSDSSVVALRRADFADDFETVHPDEIMTNVSKNSLVTTLGISLIFHLVLLTSFSVGYIQDSFHYKTLTPKLAKQAEAKEKRMAEMKKKAEEAAKRRASVQAEAEKQVREDNEKREAQQSASPALSTSQNDIPNVKASEEKYVPEILKDINEISDERPTTSDLFSIDDDF